MRILAIGDVGVQDGMIHIGDEAMFEALVDALRLRGVDEVTGISSAPLDTAARYGIDAIHTIDFRPSVVDDRAGAVQRMHDVLATADGATGLLTVDDPAHAVIAAVRAAEGVVIAGGGNMASTWPMHIVERATLGALAERFGTPLVVTGQTIGPALTGPDADLVAGLLASARLVGVREGASFALCWSLGIDPGRIVQTLDDASFVAFAPGAATPRRAPYCLVTLANHVGAADRDDVERGAAALLDGLAAATGLEIVMAAHFGSLLPGEVHGDDLVHRRVARHMTTPVVLERARDTAASAALARGAALIVSSRYHPVVFGSAVGVPTVGIAVDDYTAVKLTGALDGAGQRTVITVDDLVLGTALADALPAWHEGAVIRAAGGAALAGRIAAKDAWWDRVVRTLETGTSSVP